MTDVTLRPVDPGVTHIDKYDVLVDGIVAGRIERSRRDWTDSITRRWESDGLTRRRPVETTKWEASPAGTDDWWEFRSRKGAIAHAIGGEVGKITILR